jgi:hypothetical protein
MNNKGWEGVTIGVLISIVLLTTVLVFLVIGLYRGGGDLNDVIVNSIGGESNYDDIKRGCEIACSGGSVYEYCDRERRLVMEDGSFVEDTCFGLRGVMFDAKRCDVGCGGEVEIVDGGDEREDEDNKGTVDDSVVSDNNHVVISGRVINGLTKEPLVALFNGVNYESSDLKYSEEGGFFEISLEVKEGFWWFEKHCYSHLFYEPKPSYIEILEVGDEGFLLRGPDYERRVLFSELVGEDAISPDIGDFSIYPSWSIQMRSLDDDVFFSFYYESSEGEIMGFPHGSITSGIFSPYIVPRDKTFYVQAIDALGNSYRSDKKSIPSNYVDCGLVDVLFSVSDGKFTYTMEDKRDFTLRDSDFVE